MNMIFGRNACFQHRAVVTQSLCWSQVLSRSEFQQNGERTGELNAVRISVDYMTGSALFSNECTRCVSGCPGQYHELEAWDPGWI